MIRRDVRETWRLRFYFYIQFFVFLCYNMLNLYRDGGTFMKRKNTVIAAIVLATTMITTPVLASEAVNIDLDSMSIDELMNLKGEVDQKIADKGGDNTIGQGVYYVGTDIKVGNFKITPMSDMHDVCVNIAIYNDEETYKNDTSQENYDDFIKLWKPDEGEKPQSGNLNLKEGQIMCIWCGEAIIEESHASWMPDKE